MAPDELLEIPFRVIICELSSLDFKPERFECDDDDIIRDGSGGAYFTEALMGLRSLLRHQIREDRAVWTDGCRQATEFTSAKSFGVICILDQKGLIEPDTPYKGCRGSDRTAKMSLALSAEETCSQQSRVGPVMSQANGLNTLLSPRRV